MSQTSHEVKNTPLHEVHVRLGARMIEFGGWEMPVQYTSLLAEHRAVRGSVGLFDLSHMGEFFFSGPDAAKSLQRLLTNDVHSLVPGRAHYTLICTEKGGVVDDVILYYLGEDRYMLVVNAANIDKDREWIRKHLEGRVALDDKSEETALLAVQGPKAESVIACVVDQDVSGVPAFHAFETDIGGVRVLLSRTGYTGEDGFEVYCDSAGAAKLWETLIQAGRKAEIVPVGLGARDTLRLEARLPLYGNDLTEETTPLQAGLSFAVKLDKDDFIGREALQLEREQGPAQRLVGFEMTERGIPRHGYPILHDGERAGEVTSGSFSPTLEKNIGMGYVPTELSQGGAELGIEIRGQCKAARVVKGRFVPARTKKG